MLNVDGFAPDAELLRLSRAFRNNRGPLLHVNGLNRVRVEQGTLVKGAARLVVLVEYRVVAEARFLGEGALRKAYRSPVTASLIRHYNLLEVRRLLPDALLRSEPLDRQLTTGEAPTVN